MHPKSIETGNLQGIFDCGRLSLVEEQLQATKNQHVARQSLLDGTENFAQAIREFYCGNSE
jgi:hypothetical protein